VLGEVVAQVAVEVLCTNGPFGNASVVIINGDGMVAGPFDLSSV
jgi:hypothetical protein